MAERAVHSMTGSGTATGECELGRVTVELRSVNGRNLSIRFRTSPECAGVEGAVEQLVRERFLRGTVSVAIDVVESARASAARVDGEAFDAALDSLRALAQRGGIEPPTVRDVLALPGVVITPSSERSRASWEPSASFTALITEALDRLVGRRIAEAEKTVASMFESIDALSHELAAVQERAPRIVTDHRAAILARVNEFLNQHAAQLEPEHVIREVALFADRVDVSEEVQRLGAHLECLRDELNGSGPVGRDVEFLLQEMLREVNTLGSKSPDVAISHRVVAMKSAIDKLKEQAANLE